MIPFRPGALQIVLRLQVRAHRIERYVAAIHHAHDLALVEHGHLLQMIIAEHAANFGKRSRKVDSHHAFRCHIHHVHAHKRGKLLVEGVVVVRSLHDHDDRVGVEMAALGKEAHDVAIGNEPDRASFTVHDRRRADLALNEHAHHIKHRRAFGHREHIGNGGNDILDGGEGSDYLYGGAGNDTYIFNIGYGTDTINDSEGINTISFGSGLSADTMSVYRTNWNDLTITFDGIEDKLIIQNYFTSEENRNFNVNFADGTRYAYDSEENPLKQVHATEYDDWMSAWSDNGIVIHGDGGNDTLNGGAGNDALYGGTGTDYLYGNDGDDILDGGEDNDYLNGGNGNDTYVFGRNYGTDIIEDYDGNNKIVLSGIDLNEVTFTKTNQSELTVSINGSEDKLTIRNFNSESFIFEFAGGAVGTVNKDTWELELSQPASNEISEKDVIQSNAELLSDIYSDESMSSDLLTEINDTVLIDSSSTVSAAKETEETADQTDIQVMILTENMSAFGTENNVSDSMSISDPMQDTSALNQLLVGTQAE